MLGHQCSGTSTFATNWLSFSRKHLFSIGLCIFLLGGHCAGQSDTCLPSWLSMKEQMRASLSHLRQPKYDCLLLSRDRGKNGSCEIEPLFLSNLPDRLILVIGGLQSSCDASQQFAFQLEQCLGPSQQVRVGAFDYPNDGSLRESGDVLYQFLSRISASSPKTKITLVGHSMGGLVARYSIEAQRSLSFESIHVDQLIMICPPNHGSVLAQYADVLEFADALERIRSAKGSLSSQVLSLIDDGLGEACDDLVPNSPFLRELNRNLRAPGVRYSIFAGTQGPLDPAVRLTTSLVVNELSHWIRPDNHDAAIVIQSVRRTSDLLCAEELIRGLGDGAVSMESAKLDGVGDFVRIPIQHTQWCRSDLPPVQLLIRMVADRIRSP